MINAIKLYIGCGKKYLKGYSHLDIIKYKHVDYVCPSWDIPLPNESVSVIYSRHFFEHLSPFEVKKTLIEWNRVLVLNGKINLIMPNLAYHCKQLLKSGNSPLPNHNISNLDHAIRSIYGWIQNENLNTPHMEHKWGYTPNTIKTLLSKYNYVNISFKEKVKWDLNVTGYKKKVYKLV